LPAARLGSFFHEPRKARIWKDPPDSLPQIAEVVATVIYKSRLFQELVERNQYLVRQADLLKRTPIATH